MSDYLFVYGTLMRGGSSPMAALLAEGAHFCGAAELSGRLFWVADYPGATLSATQNRQPGDRVLGDLYRLPDEDPSLLAALDDYEGCSDRFAEPTEFSRQACTVTRDTGESLTAWVYLYNGDADGLPVIASGDFAAEARSGQRPASGFSRLA